MIGLQTLLSALEPIAGWSRKRMGDAGAACQVPTSVMRANVNPANLQVRDLRETGDFWHGNGQVRVWECQVEGEPSGPELEPA